MKIGIMQPYFFPYLGYWQLLAAVDKYVIYDDVNYIKNGWINRNNILLAGKPHLLTIPLEGASSFSLIKDVRMTSNKKVLRSILKTLTQAYAKAPFFSEILPIVEEVLSYSGESIASALIKQFELVKKYLGIKTELIVSSAMQKNRDLHAQDKVIHICEILGADDYYNAIGGQAIYDYESFSKKGITLNFLKMRPMVYGQFKNEFVPNLSMIDVLMFNSPDAIHQLLTQYDLVSCCDAISVAPGGERRNVMEENQNVTVKSVQKISNKCNNLTKFVVG